MMESYFLVEVYSAHVECCISAANVWLDFYLAQLQCLRLSAFLKFISDENFYNPQSLWKTATEEYPYGFTSLSSHAKPIVHSSGLDL